MAVQAHGLDYRSVERSDEVVGEQVGAWFFFEELLNLGLAGVEVVAVEAGEAAYAGLGGQLIEGAVGAAVGVGQDGTRPLRLGRRKHPFGMAFYLLRAVVQGGGEGANRHRPASAGGDLADVARQRAAGDDLNGPARVTKPLR